MFQRARQEHTGIGMERSHACSFAASIDLGFTNFTVGMVVHPSSVEFSPPCQTAGPCRLDRSY